MKSVIKLMLIAIIISTLFSCGMRTKTVKAEVDRLTEHINDVFVTARENTKLRVEFVENVYRAPLITLLFFP